MIWLLVNTPPSGDLATNRIKTPLQISDKWTKILGTPKRILQKWSKWLFLLTRFPQNEFRENWTK